MSIFPIFLASPLPTCQRAEGGGCWHGPTAPDIPSAPLPRVPSPGTEKLEANAQYSNTLTGR